MITITINQTDNIDNDLNKLDQITNVLDVFPGNDEVKLKIIDQWYEITLMKMKQRVDAENADMLELLFGIEGIEVEL